MLSLDRSRAHWDCAITAPIEGVPDAAALGVRADGALALAGDPAGWAEQLRRALRDIAAARPRARVLVIVPEGLAEIEAPAGLRLGIVSSRGGSWGVALRGVADIPLVSPERTGLGAALRSCGARARLLARREALGGTAAQLSPDGVGLTGTPTPPSGSGPWKSQPFALDLKDFSSPPSSIGSLVVYQASDHNPGQVQGFAPGQDCWKWSGTAWPASFQITQAGGDAGADKSIGTWITHTEGPISQPPSTPSGGVWYDIRRPGSGTIIGFFWKDQITNPSSFRWYGKTTSLHNDRFDTASAGLQLYQRTSAPTVFANMKMYIVP